MANNPHCSWDQCNDIFNLHIRGAQGRTRCFSCGGRDHFASTCPNKRYSTSTNARSLGLSRSSGFGSRAAAFPPASRPSTHLRRCPVLTPSSQYQHHSPQSFVVPSIFASATSLPVVGSTDVSNVTNLTLPPTATTLETDLSLLPDSSYISANSVFSRINVSCLSSLLKGYPISLVNFLISGFSIGFRIGFLGKLSFGREKNNHANENGGDVSKAILRELHRGHIMGPFAITLI